MTDRALNRRQLIVGAGAAAVCTGCVVDVEMAGDITGELVGNVVGTDTSGFGAMLNMGLIGDVIKNIRDNAGFWYVPQGRMWLVEYPADSLGRARQVYSSAELVAMEAGVVALFQKCPHLGCRVPSCATSQWFECPCHGSKYNRVGEKRGGPAPRGMDRFGCEINQSGELIVNTATVFQGPEIGTDTTRQEAEGPNCIGESS